MSEGTLELENHTSPSEECLDQLVARAKGGCEETRTKLFAQLFHDLQTKIASYTGNGPGTPSRSASDFAQEAWIKIAARFAGEFRGETYRSLGRWALITLSGEFLNAQKRAARRRELHRDVWQSILAPKQLNQLNQSLLDRVIHDEELARVEGYFGRLTLQEQTILYLRFWEGLKVKEIAARLKIDERMVRRRREEAITQLREWFDDGEQ